MNNTLKNPHVGEILKLDFLDELNLSQNALAQAIKVAPNRIHAIVKGERSITADTDLRLCAFFGLSDGFFMRLQMTYELARTKKAIASIINEIKPYALDNSLLER